MFSLAKKVGIDLGTTTTLVYVEGKGVVFNEPSVVAMSKKNNKILAIGEEAKKMLGKTPSSIVAVKPMRDGVIADYVIIESMLKYYINKIYGRWTFFPPYLMICIPTTATSVERRAIKRSALRIGCRKVFLIEEPKAAAIGANLDIAKPEGNMVIDVGGGTTDIATLSLGEIVVGESLRMGSNGLDEAIQRYMRKCYNLAIGDNSAEQIKQKIGYATSPQENEELEVRGRDLVNGLPHRVKIRAEEICKTLSENLSLIMEGVKVVLEKTPPELAADIVNKGIVMTGGGSLLKNFDRLIKETTGISTCLADDPSTCVVIGTGRALQNIELLK
ncbi:MAG: rod shape-determining protein [Candidatus Aerophobetes bacterium]|nr:rod shape-determining protein [Candidatus Aerophobetes bacterium]